MKVLKPNVSPPFSVTARWINLPSILEEGFFRVFYLYTCTGNLWRFFPTPYLKENVLLTEFLLYVFCFFYFLLRKTFYQRHLNFLLFSSVILLSSLYGAFMNGFDIGSTLYAVRLVCLVLCGLQIGEIFFHKFGTSVPDLYKFLSKCFGLQLIFGFFIYALFRDSRVLWNFLCQLGITFVGDPHIGRFLSVYLDPNFYAVIALIPLIAMYRLARIVPSRKQWVLFIALLLSIVLTWSRSGIGSLFLLLAYLGFDRLIKPRIIFMTKKMVMGALLGIGCLGAVLSFRLYDAAIFFKRTIGVSTEGSAFSRLYSFRIGLEIFYEHPLLGVGYNYLTGFIKEVSGQSSIDCSVLATFVNFGLFGSLIFFVLFIVWLCQFQRSIDRICVENKELYVASKLYTVYLLIVIVFASIFNNLLYFQFWLVPMVALFTYFSLCVKETLLKRGKTPSWKAIS